MVPAFEVVPSPPPVNAGQEMLDKFSVIVMVSPSEPGAVAVIITVGPEPVLPVTPTVEFVIAVARLLAVVVVESTVPEAVVKAKYPAPVWSVPPPDSSCAVSQAEMPKLDEEVLTVILFPVVPVADAVIVMLGLVPLAPTPTWLPHVPTTLMRPEAHVPLFPPLPLENVAV